MKVCIDAFNIGLNQPTGLGTYSKEIAKLLTKDGHDVYPLYGVNLSFLHQTILTIKFIQKLGIINDTQRENLSSLIVSFFFGLPLHLLGLPFLVKKIEKLNQFILGSAHEKIAHHQEIYNSSNIFRLSQAFSVFTGKSTKITLPKQADIFHLTSPLPLSVLRTPKVVTVHDVIPIIFPSSTKVNVSHYYKMIKASLKDASVIFCVSENSRLDLIKYFDIPEKKIHITYESADLPTVIQNLKQKDIEIFLKNNFKFINYKKYFIFYGAIEPKKNVKRIIEAFQKAKTEFPILIVGKDGWLHQDVDLLLNSLWRIKSNRKRFIRVPYISFLNLMTLLKGARGLVFPSFYEGFGLPVLEAMQIGCPVITSNVSSLPEVGGDAVHYVDPYDVLSIASAIDKISSDDIYTQQLVKRGHKQALRFSKEEHLKRLLAGYQKAIR